MSADSFVNVEFQISLLLFFAVVGYFLATRFNQSIVIGEILVGIIIGPSVLGWITLTDFVNNLAIMGSIFLLFVVGLQTKFKEVYTLRSTLIALAGVFVPWVAGYFLALFFGYGQIEGMFVGTALAATSIAITAHVLREMGQLGSAAAKAIIGAAVVDDVLSLLALSLTRQFAEQATVSFDLIGTALFSAGAFLFLSLLFGVFLISPLLKRWDEWAVKRGIGKSTFILAIAIAFLYSMLAEIAGLSAIVGAFVAGVSLEALDISSYREGAEYLEIIFASIFFVSLGVLIDIGAITGPVAIFLIVLTVVAIASKFVGCFIPAILTGLNKVESTIVGVGMVPRGEISMIVGLYALNAGLIQQDLYSAIMLMSLLTTIAAPVVLRWLYSFIHTGRPRVIGALAQ
ncbi:MAG: cation:proton antiporter [Candidatus Micrarchaeota archaeon]